MKPLEELKLDEMYAAARSLFGFELDELKTMFPTEDKMREFLTQARKGRGLIAASADEEKDIGWDSEDSTPLDDEAKKVVMRRKAKRAAALAESVSETGSGVTPSDVKSILSDLNREDTEEDGEVEAPPTQTAVKAKPKKTAKKAKTALKK